jgi:F-type H+-transporting ATPase subunit epsilon
MPNPFTFELVSPEKLLFSGEVQMVTIPGAEGNFGVLAEHAPLISAVRPGVIHVFENDTNTISQKIFVSGGFAEVTGDRCTMLADSAVAVEKIDRSLAEQDLLHLMQAEEKATDEIEKRLAARKLEVARAKVNALAA